MDLITPAIPFFFLLMGVELVAGRISGRRIFRGPDVTTCLATGTLQVIFTVVFAGVLSFLYNIVFDHRIITLPEGEAWVYVVGFVGVDFCYYWFHRAGHRMMLGWATHAPHHSSEDYNLAVALRQGPIQPLFSRFFYLPLALIGLPYPIFVTMVSVNTLYQFWIHTELIGKLGPLEWFLNTPSHHRVHHGCNGKYLDKNHAGIFIVWDRLFGTFIEEADTPVYGTVKQSATWNPLLATWQPFGDIGRKWQASLTWGDRVRSFIAPPEWLPPGMIASPAVTGRREKAGAGVDAAVLRYAAVAFVSVLLASVGYFVVVATTKLSWTDSAVIAAWLTWSYGSVGALLDGWAPAKASEVARHVVGLPVVVLTLGMS